MAKAVYRRMTDLIGFLARGKFAERCDEHLEDALRALEAQPDGKGSVTITMTLVITAQEDLLDVKPTVKSKLPEEKGFAATPFWMLEGGFSVQHPSQSDMFPRDVSEGRFTDRAGG